MHQYMHSNGTTGTNTITVWTEAGRKFIYGEIKETVKRREPEAVSY
ncbi:MAG: hypothetical protein LBL33_09130 [Tannerella sp.]|nr:hypothetical protein [Tannerella sp.]